MEGEQKGHKQTFKEKKKPKEVKQGKKKEIEKTATFERHEELERKKNYSEFVGCACVNINHKL